VILNPNLQLYMIRIQFLQIHSIQKSKISLKVKSKYKIKENENETRD